MKMSTGVPYVLRLLPYYQYGIIKRAGYTNIFSILCSVIEIKCVILQA